MADAREVSIVIRGTNLSAEAFQKAREQLAGLKTKTDEAGRSGETFGQTFLGAKNVTSLFSNQIKALVSGFTIASLLEKGVSAIADWTSGIYDNASALVNQKEKTHASIEWLQRWQEAERKSDIATGSLAQASVNLGRTLQEIAHGGGQDAIKALEDLGLSSEALKGKTPEEKLDLVIRSLASLTDVEKRNYDGKILLGKSFDNVSQSIGGYGQAVDGARVQSEGQVIALHAQAEAIKDVKKAAHDAYQDQLGLLALTFISLKNAATGQKDYAAAWSLATQGVRVASFGLVDLDKTLQSHGLNMSKLISQQGQLTEDQKRYIETQKAAGVSTDMLVRLVGANADVVRQYADSLKSAKPNQSDFTQQFAAAQKAVSGLNAEQRAQISAGVAMNKSNKEIADQLNKTSGAAKITEEAVGLYKDQLQESKKTADDSAQKHRELKDALDRAAQSTQGVTQETYAQIVAMKARNVSESDIALILKVTGAQVTSVMESEKARADNAKAQGKLIADVEKFNYDNSVKYWKDQQAMADTKGQKLIELVNLEGSTGERLKQLWASTHDAEILKINESERAELSALAVKYDKNTTYYTNAKANITAYYQYERDIANGTASTLEARMAQQGIFTRAEQQATVDALKRDWEQMKASGLYTYAELAAAEKRWRDASNAMSHQGLLGMLGNFDKVLAGASAFATGVGGKFGEVANKAIGVAKDVSSMATSFATGDWIGGATKALGLLGSAIGALGNSSKKGREEFAASMNMSLDGLYKKLQTMGAEGQRLANQALNVIGKHDEAGNKAWMAEVSKFFTNHTAQLQHEDDVLKTYTANWANLPKAMQSDEIHKAMASLAADQGILTAHGFSAQEAILAEADAYNELIAKAAAAGGVIPQDLRAIGLELERNGKLTDDNKLAIAGYGAEAIKQLKTLNDEYKSLADAVANEAPEDVMGIVEQQQRARMADIQNQKAALQQQMDDQAAAGDVAVSQIKDSAREAYRQIKQEWEGGLHIPVWYDAQNSPNDRGGDVPHYASGGIAEGRQMAVIAERGRKEIVGDESFIGRAIKLANDRGSGNTITNNNAGPIQVFVAVEQATGRARQITREMWQELQQGVSGGLLSIPAAAIGRTR